MSLHERKKAKRVIELALKDYHSLTPIRMANVILNKLLKAGYLNDKVVVQADDVFNELQKSPFKCRIEE
jgi:hypothetical protein